MTFSRRKRIWLVLIGLALFSWLAHSTYRSLALQNAAPPVDADGSLATGSVLPKELELPAGNGGPKFAAALRGKVTILNFWASWCAPCLHEMPGLYALHKKLENRGFQVIGLNMDSDPAAGLQSLERIVGKSPFPMLPALDSPFAEKFSIQALPYTVLIDRELKIQYSKAGELNWQDEKIYKMIEGLL